MASWGSGQFLSTIILLAVLFGDCSGKEQIPKDILSKQQMTHLMIQVHLLEAKVGKLGLLADSSKKVFQHFENLLMERENVDTAIFSKSFLYYSKNPELFSKIYNAVVDSLIEYESREKLMKEQKLDSLEVAKMDSVVVDSLKITNENNAAPVEKFKRPVKIDSVQKNNRRLEQ